jgi:hypothetical protein
VGVVRRVILFIKVGPLNLAVGVVIAYVVSVVIKVLTLALFPIAIGFVKASEICSPSDGKSSSADPILLNFRTRQFLPLDAPARSRSVLYISPGVRSEGIFGCLSIAWGLYNGLPLSFGFSN